MAIKRILVLSAIPLLIGGFGFTVSGKAVAEQSTLVAQNQNQSPSNGQRSGWKGQNGPFSRLGLSEEQQAQIKQIHESSRQQMDAVLTAEQKEQLRVAKEQRQRPNLNLSEEQRNKMNAIRTETKSKIEGVLTAQQRQQLQELKQQRQQRGQQQQS